MNASLSATYGHGLKAALPYLLILFIGITWGMTFSLARIVAESGAHPLGLTFWQAAGGCVILWIFCLFNGKRVLFNRAILKQYCVIGLAGTVIPSTLFFYAAAHVPAGILAITIALVPMITYAGCWALRIDQFQRKRFIGIVFGFLAILLLMLPESSLPDPGMVKWVLLAVVAVVFYSIENIYIDIAIPEHTDLVPFLAGALLVASVILVLPIYQQQAFVAIHYPFTRVEWSLVALAVVSSLAYVAFLYVVKLAGAVFGSLAGYLITLSGVFWGMVFFGEQHSGWVWAALLLMLFGMALVTPRRSDQQIASPPAIK